MTPYLVYIADGELVLDFLGDNDLGSCCSGQLTRAQLESLTARQSLARAALHAALANLVLSQVWGVQSASRGNESCCGCSDSASTACSRSCSMHVHNFSLHQAM